MSCYSPLRAWRGSKNVSGKLSIVFARRDSKFPKHIELPCGQCVGCRLERSRQWAMRCVHESSLYERNCFLTLTFDDKYLPSNGSVSVRDTQLFMKRLRKANPDDRIRFFLCGEYGEKCFRPHYHACIFNFDFDDKVFFKFTSAGHRLYTSDSLTRIWGLGHALIGDVTFDSAAYVARYIMKKVTGELAPDFYRGRKPEFITMSRRPGIGKAWYDRFKSDVYPHDYVVVNGVKVRPPKFYDGLFELDDPASFANLKRERKGNSAVNVDVNGNFGVNSEYDSRRLVVKEQVKLSRISTLTRPLEVLT